MCNKIAQPLIHFLHWFTVAQCIQELEHFMTHRSDLTIWQSIIGKWYIKSNIINPFWVLSKYLMYLLKIGWRSWCWWTCPVLIMKTRTRDTVYRFVSGSNLHQISLKSVTEFLRNRAHLKAKTWGWKHNFSDGVNNAIIIIIHYNNNITESTPLNTVSTKRPYSFQDCWLHYIVHGLYFYWRVYQLEVTQNFQFIDRTCSQHSWSFTHNDKKIVFITDEVIQQKGLSESY